MRRKIVCRDHAVHARHRQRARDIEFTNVAMGDWTAQNHAIEKIRTGQIRDIGSGPTQEAKILAALDRRAD